MITREQALELLKAQEPDDYLWQHSLYTEAIMRALAPRFAGEPEAWGVCGLLHDLDFPHTKDTPEQHGLKAKAMLETLGINSGCTACSGGGDNTAHSSGASSSASGASSSAGGASSNAGGASGNAGGASGNALAEPYIYAIVAHNSEYSGCAPKAPLDYALRCAETITGLISAAAKMRPEGMQDMQVKSIKKKIKDKAFARAVSRERIMECEQLGLSLDDFIAISIEAMS